MKALLLVRPLLWVNRWLLLLLLVWPYVMAALLLVGDAHPWPDDVASLLRQECLYGVALVAFGGASLLGNEQRSRRIITVLARAVGRSEYLLALLLAAWIPLMLYVVGFSLSALVLVRSTGVPLDAVWAMALLQLVAGLWMGCTSIFFSTFLPSIFASLASVATGSLLAFFVVPGPGAVITSLMGMPLTRVPPLDVGSIALTLLASVVSFAAAIVVFARRDLTLTSD